MVTVLSIVLLLSLIPVCVLGIWGVFLLVTSRGFSTAPTVASTGAAKKALLTDIGARLTRAKKTQTVMDLGSGYGTLLIPLARQFPQHHFIGYEWGFVAYCICKIRCIGIKNITLYRRDFFTADISNANIIVLFLIPFLMKRMEQKCQAEARTKTIIYANRFKFPTWQPNREIALTDSFNHIYIYETGRISCN